MRGHSHAKQKIAFFSFIFEVLLSSHPNPFFRQITRLILFLTLAVVMWLPINTDCCYLLSFFLLNKYSSGEIPPNECNSSDITDEVHILQKMHQNLEFPASDIIPNIREILDIQTVCSYSKKILVQLQILKLLKQPQHISLANHIRH